MGKEFGDLGQGTRRWWCTDDGHRVGPGVPVERVSQHGLVSVYMCVRGCGCLSFRFPVSTGELQSGDMDSWHICARRAGMFSLLPHSAGSAWPPFESVSWEGNSFPKWKSHNVAVCANRVYYTQGKGFWKDELDMFEKEKWKIRNRVLFLQNHCSSTLEIHSVSFVSRLF